MKTQSSRSGASAEASAIVVRTLLPDQVKWFDGLLANHHALGAGRPVGDYLRQVVERNGQPMALWVWGPAACALKDRDRWISWSVNQRLERPKLIVQNRRFLVLTARGQSPNLASQAMGAALRALPEQWQEHFGYRPRLAGSFTDSEAYAGNVSGVVENAVGGSPEVAGVVSVVDRGVRHPACRIGWLPATRPGARILLTLKNAQSVSDTRTRH